MNNSSVAVAEYYAKGILYPIPLENIISTVPKDTILVEIVSHCDFQSIIRDSLGSTVTLISLCKHGQRNTIQDLLEGIGDFYNIGFQPQISSLYPPVQFPVSRGTPMISPLVRCVFQDIRKRFSRSFLSYILLSTIITDGITLRTITSTVINANRKFSTEKLTSVLQSLTTSLKF